jgi:hypothetical protein
MSGKSDAGKISSGLKKKPFLLDNFFLVVLVMVSESDFFWFFDL